MIIHKGNLAAPMGYHNGIPIWDSRKYVIPPEREPFYVENISDTEEIVIIKKSNSSAPSISIYISNDGETWSRLGTTSTTGLTISLPVGSKVYMRASVNTWYSSSSNYITGCSKVGGNIMSLIYGDSFTGEETSFRGSTTDQFRLLFYSNHTLRDASELILPVTTLTQTCYREMFSGCTSLTISPKIKAETLGPGSCMAMFLDCHSLNSVSMYATDISADNCLNDWLEGVSATGTFYKHASTTYPSGTYGIPTGWTVVDL